MKTILGLILILLSVFLGLYVGVWLLFIGGIVQAVEAIKATPVEAMGIALGLLRVICSGIGGVLTFIFCLVPGVALIKN